LRDGRLSLLGERKKKRLPTILFILTTYCGGVIMVNGNAGKGDTYRKVDQKKWDENWERSFGKKIKAEPNVMKPGGIIDMTDIPKEEKKKKDSKQ
jgi:hypothetical protein